MGLCAPERNYHSSEKIHQNQICAKERFEIYEEIWYNSINAALCAPSPFQAHLKGVSQKKKSFGHLPSGQEAALYTISRGGITAKVTDYGAHLVSLLVPDRNGRYDDVVLGFDDANGYRLGEGFIGAMVGRSANRIAGSQYTINDRTYHITPNEGPNNLHSGPDFYHLRMWQVREVTDSSITLLLNSPDGDQGYPGNAEIRVTYRLDSLGALHLV